MKDDDGWDYVVVPNPSEKISHVLRALFFTLFHVPTFTRAFSRATFFARMQTSNTHHAIMRATMRGHDVTVCACIFFLSMREESQSRDDKIELGDELVKILIDSFVEI